MKFSGAAPALAAVAMAAGTFWAARGQDSPRSLDVVAFALIAVAVGVLAWRRSAPLVSLAVSVAATGAYLLAGYPYGPVLLSVGWAMFEVASRRPVRQSGIAAAIAAVAAVLTVLPRLAGELNLLVVGLALWAGLWLAVPWSLGALRYVRRQAADRARTDLVARTVLEERIRLSREVHDVAGHGFAVVAMQAGVALTVLDEQPDQVRTSLEAIRDASTSALTELRQVLGSSPAVVEPGLETLPALVERARTAGLTVELETVDPAEVPAGAGGLAYRVVRESLTNVLRHAGPAAGAEVIVERTDGMLTVTITDDGRGADSAGENGSGLAALRARVETAGGHLIATGGAGGGFQVSAHIPLNVPR